MGSSQTHLHPDATLTVRTITIPDVPNLLALLANNDALAWVRGTVGNQEGLVGWNVLTRMEFSGPERFSRAQRWWSNWCSCIAGDHPMAFTSFSFDNSQTPSVLLVPQIVIRRFGNTTTLTVTAAADEVEDVLLAAAQQVSRTLSAQSVKSEPARSTVTWLDGSIALEQWQSHVASAIDRINAGEIDKVVLARDIVAQSDSTIDCPELLRALNSTFPECWTFSVDGLFGATPELLIRRHADQVTSRVLAGTIRRSSDSNRDGQLATELFASQKAQEEHAYAVESVASALAKHCTDLKIPKEPFILQLANVQHLATDINGSLVESTTALSLAAALHPTAAVCGTPTERALSVIEQLEGSTRGRYAGPVGWIDAHQDGEFGIALRCAQVEGAEERTLRLFAGCGIVAGSTVEAEVAESDAKFAAIKNLFTK